MLRVHTRWMIRRDLYEVLQIEQESFEWDWSEEDFLKCLSNRSCIGMVAEHDDKVIGFMIYQLSAAKLHVLNFAVHPEYRRLGVGRQLAAWLVRKLSSHRRTRIVLTVRETNLDAQFFFRSVGFRALRVLRDYYEIGEPTAYLFRYQLPAPKRVRGGVA